jgi:predicted transcriptional regulator
MKNDKKYNLILQILEIVSDKQWHHINDIITRLVFINNISLKDKNKLLETNNDNINIKSFDQDVQIALTHLLVFEYIKSDNIWSLNIEYTSSYSLTDKGIEFINQIKDVGEKEKINLLKLKMGAITETIKKK